MQTADIVTLHVPELPSTKLMIGSRELALMKKGSFLINASRGSVVDLDALAEAVKSGHIAGTAVDGILSLLTLCFRYSNIIVYPSEPFANGPGFTTVLQGCPNTILTPHIGGSTVEAQVCCLIFSIIEKRLVSAKKWPRL